MSIGNTSLRLQSLEGSSESATTVTAFCFKWTNPIDSFLTDSGTARWTFRWEANSSHLRTIRTSLSTMSIWNSKWGSLHCEASGNSTSDSSTTTTYRKNNDYENNHKDDANNNEHCHEITEETINHSKGVPHIMLHLVLVLVLTPYYPFYNSSQILTWLLPFRRAVKLQS